MPQHCSDAGKSLAPALAALLSRESQGEPAMENSDERVHLSARLFTGGPIRCLVGHSSIGNGPKGMSGQTQASVDPDESRWLILSSSLFFQFHSGDEPLAFMVLSISPLQLFGARVPVLRHLA